MSLPGWLSSLIKNFMRSQLAFIFASATLVLAPLSGAADAVTAPKITPKKSNSKATTYTVYAAGDIAECKKAPADQSIAARTADIIFHGLEGDKNAIAITLGDNTYPVGQPEEFSNCYEPTWGRLKSARYLLLATMTTACQKHWVTLIISVTLPDRNVGATMQHRSAHGVLSRSTAI